MMDHSMNQVIDFEIREMLWLELDFAVGAFALGRNRRYLNEKQIKIYRMIPRDWYELAQYLLPDSDNSLMLFEMMGLLCPPAMMDESYATIRAYLQNIGDFDWKDRFEEAGVKSISAYLMKLVQEEQADVEESYINMPRLYQIIEQTAEQIEKIFSRPVLEESFWKWLDIFVEHYYLRWRKHYEETMQVTKERFEALRSVPGGCTLGMLLDVLPGTNALHYRSSLRGYLVNGRLPLTIWVEPFGLFDSWTIFQKRLVISVSVPGDLFSVAKDEIEEIAEKSKALGDPTRLGILRIIRHFDMDITEIAEYFGISRPTVSVHIKKLREAGLVDSFDDGRSTRHKVNMANMRALLGEISRFLELGDGE